MRFRLMTRHVETGREKVFLYDNQDGTLRYENGSRVPVRPISNHPTFDRDYEAPTFDKDHPLGKIARVKRLKIQLGLSCNYSCDYCNQRFVPRADETSRKQVQPFLDNLDKWMVGSPERIEFWGGEPLVYIKTMVPLATVLRERYPDAQFSMITNGSLLTKEINAWLDDMGFAVAVSHDGPGQFVRGPDPMDDPEKKESIMDLYHRLTPKGRFSFNSMVNNKNMDRAAIQKFFVELTGNPNTAIGEGSFIDAYDGGGLDSSVTTTEQKLTLRNTTLRQLQQGEINNFMLVHQRLTEWVDSFAYARPAKTLSMKCGMDRVDHVAVDLHGNIITCQNVSIMAMAPNGHGHKIGDVDHIEDAKLTTAHHWSKNEVCQKCPVLQVCKGACMFLEGPLFWATCENAYSDHIGFLAYAVQKVTGGYLPYRIEDEEGFLPEHRKTLWTAPAKPAGAPGVKPRAST